MNSTLDLTTFNSNPPLLFSWISSGPLEGGGAKCILQILGRIVRLKQQSSRTAFRQTFYKQWPAFVVYFFVYPEIIFNFATRINK